MMMATERERERAKKATLENDDRQIANVYSDHLANGVGWSTYIEWNSAPNDDRNQPNDSITKCVERANKKKKIRIAMHCERTHKT